MADENTLVLGAKVETAEALEGIKRFGQEAGADLRRLAEGGDGDARKLLLDTDEAEAALREVSEEFLRTGSASEESLAKAETALRKVSGALGFEKDLELVPPELEKISKASRDAGAAMEKFGQVAESGGQGATKAAARAQTAINRLEAAIKETRATGGAVPPQWEKQLESLRKEMARNIEVSAKFAATQRDVQDELAASTERAVGFDEQATSLTEGIIKRFPKAQGAIVGFGASLATLEVAYRQTRDFVDFMREHFGVDIDAAVRKGLEPLADAFALEQKLANNRERLRARETELEKNAANISEELRRREGETLEELEKRIDEYRGGVRKMIRDQGEAAEATRKFLDSATGIKLETLEERLGAVGVVLRNFGGDFGKLAKSGLFPAFKEEVRQLSEILDKYGVALRSTLSGEELVKFDAFLSAFQTGVREKLVGSIEYAVQSAKELLETFGVQAPEAIRKSAASLGELVKAFGPLGSVTKEQAAQIAGEADKILKSIALLPAEQRAALAEITASLHATSDAYRKHAEDVAAFAASGTMAIEEATEARLAAWQKEKQALRDLSDEAGSARDSLLSTLKAKDRPGSGADERAELQELKAKPLQSEEDIARISELGKSLQGVGRATGQLQEKQREGAASSEAVAAAIAKFREELVSTGGALNDLDKGAISAFLSRLQQTADEGNATAAVIVDAFGAVSRTVADAQQRAAELNTAAAAGAQAAQAAASQAKALGGGVQDIVGSVDEAGQTLISNLETAVQAGNKLIERTVDTGKKATGDVVAAVEQGQITITQAGSATAAFIEKYGEGAEVIAATIQGANESTGELAAGTEKAGAAIKNLVLGVDGLGAGMKRVALESGEAQEGLEGIEQTAGGAGEALELIASHATTAAEPVAKVAAGLKEAGASVGPLHASAESFRSISEDAPKLVEELSRLEPVEMTKARAEAYGALAVNLRACAVAAGQLKAALPSIQVLRDEAEALKAVAEALEAVTAGLEAERAAREGEGAPN